MSAECSKHSRWGCWECQQAWKWEKGDTVSYSGCPCGCQEGKFAPSVGKWVKKPAPATPRYVVTSVSDGATFRDAVFVKTRDEAMTQALQRAKEKGTQMVLLEVGKTSNPPLPPPPPITFVEVKDYKNE